jgi:hypothetical protein|tara:strand:+ start:51 stop:323 length:273 start_codon:yes stop_codon:yes gene_type:complete
MALKMFKDKIVPRIGDLVRPRMITDITGIVVAIKNNEGDISSEFYKNKPRKIFIVRWIGSPSWAAVEVKKEYFEHQLEVVSKASHGKTKV